MQTHTNGIEELIKNACVGLGVAPDGVLLEKLRGDASCRSFFRLRTQGGKLPGSVIAMYLPDSMREHFRPICSTRQYFESIGVPVPESYFEDSTSGLVFFEDFGDLSLEEAVKNSSTPQQVREWYRTALDIAVCMQVKTVQRIKQGAELCSFGLAFDEEKLGFEMDFFLEHFVGNYLGFEDRDAVNAMRREFVRMCVLLSNRPRYIAHRDYHSRNIIVKPDATLGVIDFQDARMGPLQYDAVSLLRDSYVDLGPELRAELTGYYKESLLRHPEIDMEGFERFWDWCALQRNIKALGTFGYMVARAGKTYFKESIPLTVGYVKQSLQTGGEFEDFYKALKPVLDQFA